MHEAMAISLLEAIKKGDDETAKRILRHRLYSNIERQGPRKDGTPLFWCCCRGDFELARLLLLHGAEVNRPTAWGASPLHAAADHNQPDVILLLIEFGANVNQQTNNGDTPCHLAAYRGYKECVRNLIQNGADVSLRNSRRHTPIQEAYIRGHTEIYTYLLNVQKLVVQPKKTLSTAQNGMALSHKSTRDASFLSESKTQSPNLTTGTSLSLPRRSVDYSYQTDYDYDSNYNTPMLKDGFSKRKEVVGVLKLNFIPHNDLSSTDMSSFRSSVSRSNTSSMNDLSSVESTRLTSGAAPKSLMSFKNI